MFAQRKTKLPTQNSIFHRCLFHMPNVTQEGWCFSISTSTSSKTLEKYSYVFFDDGNLNFFHHQSGLSDLLLVRDFTFNIYDSTSFAPESIGCRLQSEAKKLDLVFPHIFDFKKFFFACFSHMGSKEILKVNN
jgi:hypothetical protein